MQHLLVYTSDSSKLVDGAWTVNGAGLKVSHKYGFGAVDAEALVTRGKNWVNVSPMKEYSVTPKRNKKLVVTIIHNKGVLLMTVMNQGLFLDKGEHQLNSGQGTKSSFWSMLL